MWVKATILDGLGNQVERNYLLDGIPDVNVSDDEIRWGDGYINGTLTLPEGEKFLMLEIPVGAND